MCDKEKAITHCPKYECDNKSPKTFIISLSTFLSDLAEMSPLLISLTIGLFARILMHL